MQKTLSLLFVGFNALLVVMCLVGVFFAWQQAHNLTFSYNLRSACAACAILCFILAPLCVVNALHFWDARNDRDDE